MGTTNLLVKQQLDSQQLLLLQSEYNKKKKSKTVAYVLWFFFGYLGVHRFYTRDTKRALLMLFTLGGFFIWDLIDVFFIGGRVEELNEEIESNLLAELIAYNNKESK